MKLEKVIFRKWIKSEGGGIIALFPQIPVNTNSRFVQSYEHVGQHGAADPLIVINKTVPALTEEYEELKRELERRGYDLRVCCRFCNSDRKEREILIKEMSL
jgi:hypothetical protein